MDMDTTFEACVETPSPSASSGINTRSPLPFDVFSVIFDELYHEDTRIAWKTVLACTLIYREISTMVQKRIFRRVVLPSATRCTDLYSIITVSPRIATHIHELIIDNNWRTAVPINIPHTLATIIDASPNLRILKVANETAHSAQYYAAMHFSFFRPTLSSAFLTRLQTLTSLKLHKVFCLPIVEIMSSTSLKELHILDTNTRSHLHHLCPCLPFDTGCRLTDLKIDCSACLDVVLTTVNRDVLPFPPSHVEVSLKTLYIEEINAESALHITDHLLVPDLLALEYNATMNDSSDHSHPLQVISSILHSSAPPNRLRTIVISIPVTSHVISGAVMSPLMNAIDMKLTEPQNPFNDFQELRIEYVASQPQNTRFTHLLLQWLALEYMPTLIIRNKAIIIWKDENGSKVLTNDYPL
ncbi:hypothetical protein DXG01_010065 [Tephrocybe rancida]|nr:hypothetical protein DXG01_010065 [Tephrocybe rancida]